MESLCGVKFHVSSVTHSSIAKRLGQRDQNQVPYYRDTVQCLYNKNSRVAFEHPMLSMDLISSPEMDLNDGMDEWVVCGAMCVPLNLISHRTHHFKGCTLRLC